VCAVQELLSRTSLETQKLDLMDEVSYLKLKLVDMDEEQNHNDSSEDQQNKAEVRYCSTGWEEGRGWVCKNHRLWAGLP
jgi:hypothetical protein